MLGLDSTTTKSPPSSTTVDQDEHGTISSVHPDILRNHVLNRLDGPTLAVAACVSSYLHALSSEESLWREICTSTWPSINDPRVRQVISTFSSGHRSFFSDCYPLLHHHGSKPDDHHHQRGGVPKTKGLISAVDVYYRGVPISSEVVESETVSEWFLSSPFWVDLLEPKESAQIWVAAQQHGGGAKSDVWVKQLEENLTLSWILIDPNIKRAINLSSQKPVSVQRQWLTGEVEAKFATIMAGGGGRGSSKEYVQCTIAVAFAGKEGGGEVYMREVSMGMEDMEGRKLSGKDSLVILQCAMEGGERKGKKIGKEGKEMFEEFLVRKGVWKEKKESKERALDMLCQWAVIVVFLAFLSFILLG